jgi:uncharacterized membrane protein YfcA
MQDQVRGYIRGGLNSCTALMQSGQMRPQFPCCRLRATMLCRFILLPAACEGLSVSLVYTDPSFYAAALTAVIILGLAKGGFNGLGLMAVPLLALVISPVQAAAILLPVMLVQDVVSVWAYRKDFDLRNLMVMLPGSLIGIGVGWYMAASISEQMVRLMVGLIAVGFVVYHYGRALLKLTPATSNSVAAGVFWGSVSGYTSFVAHAGSPPYQVYMMPQRLPPQLYAGTATMFFAVTNFIKAISYFSLGQFTTDNIQTSLILMPLAIAATFGGVWLVRRFDKEKFYTLVYAMTFLIGCKLIADSLL